MSETRNIKNLKQEKSEQKGIFSLIILYFGKFLKFLIAGSTISIVFLLILSQFYSFRHWIISNLLYIASKELDASLAIDDLKFGRNGSLVFDKITLFNSNDTIAKIEKLELDISLLDLIDNRIKINYLELNISKINFKYNIADSSWNFEHIAKKSLDTNKKTNQNLHILINNLKLVNSSITLNKSNFTMPYVGFNPLIAQYENVNLNLNADINLKDNDFQAEILNIAFKEIKSNSVLNSLSAKMRLNNKYIQLLALNLEANSSKVKLDVRVENFDLFEKGNKDISKAILTLDLKSENFEPKYINIFAPIGFKADNIDVFNLTANGSFDDISINNANLKFANSYLNFKGSLKNASKSDELKYYVDIKDSKLITNDLSTILPEIKFNGIRFTAIKVNQIIGDGTTSDITTKLDFESEFGKMVGDAYIGYGKKVPDYNAQLSLSNFNLGGFLKDTTMRTNFNGELIVIGEGFSTKELNTDLRLVSTNSKIINYDYNNLVLDAAFKNNKFEIDTFKITFRPIDNPDQIVEDSDLSRFEASGFIDMTDRKSPLYDLSTKFSALNLSRIFKQKFAPEYMTGSIQLKGKNFDIDSMQGVLKSKFDIVVFGDRTLLPFEFDANFNKNERAEKLFTFNSSFFDIKIEGDFSYGNLISTVANQYEYLIDFFKEKVDKLLPKKDLYSDNISFVNKIRNFEKIDCDVEAHIKDLSPVSLFVPNLEITSAGDLLLNIQSNYEHSFLRFRKFDLKSIWIKNSDLLLKGNNLVISGGLLLDIKDSLPLFSDFRLGIVAPTKMEINEVLFDSSQFKFNYDGKNLGFDGQTLLNNSFKLNTLGSINVEDNQLNFDVNKLKFTFNKFLTLENNEDIKARFIDNNIFIDNFKLVKDSIEQIELTGKFNQAKSELENIKVQAYKLNINKYIKSFDIGDKTIQTLKGVMDTLYINGNGPIKNPTFEIGFNAKDLNFNGQTMGNTLSTFYYKDSVVTGKMFIDNASGTKELKNIQIDILSLPLNLAFTGVKNRIHSDSQFNIIAKTKDFNLRAIAPYVPEVTDFNGFADLELFVTGFAPDGVTYSGKATGRDISLLTNASNIRYRANGNLEFIKDTVYIKNINLFNIDEDNPKSQANITGSISLKGTDISGFDISVNAKNLLLLSEDSKKPMPNLYGKMRIATPDAPLRFFGTFKEPNLTGSVSVLEGDIIMPRIEVLQNVSSNFTYELRGQKTILKVLEPTSKDTSKVKTINNENKLYETKRSFNDNVNYNVYVKLPGKLKVDIELPLYMKMSTYLAQEDKNEPLRYEKLRTSPDIMKIYGNILVINNSTMDFLGKKLNLSGKLTYPTGSIQNPTLDMIAQFKGKTRSNGADTDYEVIIKITGTKLKPDLEYSLNLGAGPVSGEQSMRDITYLFAFGKTFAEMQRKDPGSQTDLVSETTYKLASAGASQVLNNIATKLSIIKQLDIDFNGSPENARIRLQGEILNGIEWTVGSKLNNANATEFQIDIPISRWTDKTFWQNFIIQTKYVNSMNQILTPEQILWEGKIKYGNSW